jgi:hypothetical protein
MTIHGEFVNDSTPRERRRWLLGLDPIFEGGWLHKGRRARQWDVESELIALSLLGDVTVDLADTKSAPAQVVIKAFALGRDIDVSVAPGTHVELSGLRLSRPAQRRRRRSRQRRVRDQYPHRGSGAFG